MTEIEGVTLGLKLGQGNISAGEGCENERDAVEELRRGRSSRSTSASPACR